jgi:hypothetical protein
MSSLSRKASESSRFFAGATGVAVRLALVASAAAAHAANWDFQPRVEVGGTYNDNYRLAEQGFPKTSLGGALLDAQLGIHLIEPTSDWAIIPHIHQTWFPGNSQDQSTDGFITLQGTYRTQKSTFNGVAQYSNQSVIFSELLPAAFPGVGLGETVGGPSGRTTILNRQMLTRIAPKWDYEIDPRYKLHTDLEYSKVNYAKTLFEQIGFKNIEGRLGLEFQSSLRSLFTVRGTGTRYTPDSGGSNTTTYGVEGQWDWKRSQVMHLYLRGGVDRSSANPTTGGGTHSSTGFVGGAGVGWTYQVSEIVVDVLRSLEPSAFGVVLTQNEVRSRYSRNLQPRLKGYVALRGISVSGTQTGLNIQNRNYVTGEAGFEFQMTRNYKITGAYDYTWQRFQGEPLAKSNAVTLSFVYQPPSRYDPTFAPLVAPTITPDETK